MSTPDKQATRSFDATRFLSSLSTAPGVYRMLDAKGGIIYVGKARNLKKRLSSYFRKSGVPHKTKIMLTHLVSVEITVTHTENEALLLENNLIKRHRPRYNVVLRDDKSYPYIRLIQESEFPRLDFYRGRRKEQGEYYGPYPSAAAARETINQLQKLFQLRQCSDSFFKNRSRPCLQYQIKRCSAPCVGLIESEEYRQDVAHAVMFLEGRNQAVIDELVKRMEKASTQLEFEKAADYRDQIRRLRQVQEKQYVAGDGGDLDVIAAASEAGVHCVAVLFMRSGRNLGVRTFFPQSPLQADPAEVLAAFLPQYYLGKPVPREILISHALEDAALLESSFSEQTGRHVQISHKLRGERSRWLRMARANAREAVRLRVAMDSDMRERFESLQDVLELEQLPTRIECFDISHTQGEATVASCVVFDEKGARKSDYRRFNITGITPGDDYAAMHQALTRRYTRLRKGEGAIPDLLLVDGGRGQVTSAQGVLETLQIEGPLVVGVAKGRSRKPGLEQLFLSATGHPTILPADSPALLLIQQIRDEAHRFAISGHRQRRARSRTTSVLEAIPGLGPARRRELLRQFGGLQGVARAGIDDLAAVHGISRDLAQRIYETIHAE